MEKPGIPERIQLLDYPEYRPRWVSPDVYTIDGVKQLAARTPAVEAIAGEGQVRVEKWSAYRDRTGFECAVGSASKSKAILLSDMDGDTREWGPSYNFPVSDGRSSDRVAASRAASHHAEDHCAGRGIAGAANLVDRRPGDDLFVVCAARRSSRGGACIKDFRAKAARIGKKSRVTLFRNEESV